MENDAFIPVIGYKTHGAINSGADMKLAIKIAKTVLVTLCWLAVLGIPAWVLAVTMGAKFNFWTPLEAFIHIRSWAQLVILGPIIAGGLAILIFVFGRHKIGRDAMPGVNGWIAAILAILIGLAGMMQGRSVQATARSVPPIHDISTDTLDPPGFSAALTERRGPDANSLDYASKTDPASGDPLPVVQARAYPDIQPIQYDYSPRVVFSAALESAREMGWRVPSASENTLSFEATAETFWLGFQDDVSVRISEREDGGAIMDVRSVSRVGVSDLGANAQRIRDFEERVSMLLAESPQLSTQEAEAERASEDDAESGPVEPGAEPSNDETEPQGDNP